MEKKIIKDNTDYKYFCSYYFKGDVFLADLNPIVGSEIGGIRPVIIVQNDKGNKYSTTVIVAATSKPMSKDLPTHVKISATTGGLRAGTIVLLEQIRTIDKSRLIRLIGHLDADTISEIDKALKISLDIEN